MKIVNIDIDGENVQIFWTTWEISMIFSGKMWLMVILKVKKNGASSSLSRRYVLGKTTGVGGGSNWSP